MTYCVRLESVSHLWVKMEDTPVLMRLRVPEPLSHGQLKVLSLASCDHPIKIDVTVGEWTGDAFAATLEGVSCVPPLPFKRKAKRMRTMQGVM